MWLADVITDLATIFTMVRDGRDLLRILRRRGVLSNAETNWSGMRIKGRGYHAPVIIERLDDGTDPAHQHLRIDIEPAFPADRIQKALHYWPSQSSENVVNALWIDVKAQALHDAHEGEERTCTVVLDLLGGWQYTATTRGQVDGVWEIIAIQRRLDLRKSQASSQVKGYMLGQMQREAWKKKRT